MLSTPGRHHHVVGAGHDALGGEVQGLLGGAALAVDGGGGHRLGPAGGEDGVAADIERLLGDLHHAAHDHVVDEGWVERVARLQRFQGLGGQVHGVPVTELPVSLPTCGADGIDNDGSGHGCLLPVPGGHSRPVAERGRFYRSGPDH